jgi:hypothetical protein
MTLFLTEAAGARIFAVGDTITQVTGTYQLDVQTWDIMPAGEVGDCLFRTVDVSLHCVGGYSLGVTPIVDGVEQDEQTFSGSDTGIVQCQAYLATRGTRIAARVRTLARFGDVELHTINCSFVTLRASP